MATIAKKYTLKNIGPGGMNCPCCGPAPGKRKELFRSGKRKAARMVMTEAEAEAEFVLSVRKVKFTFEGIAEAAVLQEYLCLLMGSLMFLIDDFYSYPEGDIPEAEYSACGYPEICEHCCPWIRTEAEDFFFRFESRYELYRDL